MSEERRYPLGEHPLTWEPARCLCGSDDFQRIDPKGRKRIRYRCNECEQREYQMMRDSDIMYKMHIDGWMADRLTTGAAFDDVIHEAFTEFGHKTSYNSTITTLTNELEIMKTFTEDILPCLRYGGYWSIDESAFSIRGMSKKTDPEKRRAAEEARTDYERAKARFDPKRKLTVMFDKWERLYKKMERSRKERKRLWVTGILDVRTRMMLHYIQTPNKPVTKDIYQLIAGAVAMYGMPDMITTDSYRPYAKAIMRINGMMAIKYGISCNHVIINKRHVLMGIRYPGDPHNNYVEGYWSRLKKGAGQTSNYDEFTFELMIQYHIMKTNFISPHIATGVEEDRREQVRHGSTRAIHATPAMRGGYPVWFSNFRELLNAARRHEKTLSAFMSKDHVWARMEDGRLTFTARHGLDEDTLANLDRRFQVYCGFQPDASSLEWSREMEFLHIRRTALPGYPPLPECTVTTCEVCGDIAWTMREICDMFTFIPSEEVNRDGKAGEMVACPRCYKCIIPERDIVPVEMLKDGKLIGIKSQYLHDEFEVEDPPELHQVERVMGLAPRRKNYPKSVKKGSKKGLDIGSIVEEARKGVGRRMKGSRRPLPED